MLLNFLVERKDPALFHWALSHAINHEDNTSDSGGDYFFIRKASKAIVGSGSLFALEEFLRFCVGQDGPLTYRGSRDVLMADLLNAQGRSISRRDPNYGMEKWEGSGGILGDLFSCIFDEAVRHAMAVRSNCVGAKGATASKAKIEALYSLAHWVLKQPEIAMLLASAQTRAKCIANILGDSSCIVKINALEAPHELFRMLRLLECSKVDLQSGVGGTNLMRLLFEWDATRHCKQQDLPAEVLGELRSRDEYRDDNGNTIQSLSDLLRWLALEVGVSMQHLNYGDLGRRLFARHMNLSEDQFNILKEEQLARLTK